MENEPSFHWILLHNMIDFVDIWGKPLISISDEVLKVSITEYTLDVVYFLR